MRNIKTVVAIIVIAVMLLASLMPAITGLAAESNYETVFSFGELNAPTGVSVAFDTDSIKLSDEYSQQGMALELSAKGSDANHLTGYLMEVEKGELYGSGVSFWLKGPDVNTWGAVAVRSTDGNGNVKWFKTSGQYGNPAYIMNQGDGSAFIHTVLYEQLFEVSNWQTDIPVGTESKPTEEDIQNFDVLAIGIYMWAGWPDKTAYLDTVTVLGLGTDTPAATEPVTIMDFEGENSIPANVTLGSSTDSIELVNGSFGDGNAVKVTGKINGTTHLVPLNIELSRGELNGTGITLEMQGEYDNTWGAVALRSTDENGNVKWFKTGGMYDNPAYIMTMSAGKFTVSVNFSDLWHVNNWLTDVPSALNTHPTVQDIMNFDMVCVGYYIWAAWDHDSTFYVDNVKLIGQGAADDTADKVLYDFGTAQSSPNYLNVLSGYNDKAMLTTEISEDSNALKFEAKNAGLDRVAGFTLSTTKGNLFGNGLRLWVKGTTDPLWMTVALRSTQPDGSYKWFKASTDATKPASNVHSGDKNAFELKLSYDDMHQVSNWQTDVTSVSAAVPTEQDIAFFDQVAIGVYMSADATNNTVVYVDTVGVIGKTAAPSYDPGMRYDFNDMTEITSDIAITAPNDDSISLVTDKASSGNSLNIKIKATGYTHLAGITFDVGKGNLNGTGLSFWMQNEYPNAWGTVALRSTDIDGNVKWFKLDGEYGNPARILSWVEGPFKYSLDYSSLYQVNDWLTAVPNGAGNKPTEADIANFDMVAIGCYVWDTWTTTTNFWIDDISVINPSDNVPDMEGLIEGFDKSSVVPDYIAADADAVISVKGGGQEGNSLELKSNSKPKDRISWITVDIIKGKAIGMGLSMWLKSESKPVYGAMAVHTVDKNGKEIWYRTKNTDKKGNIEFPIIFDGGDSDYTTRVAYSDLFAVDNFNTLPTGDENAPSSVDIANIDKIMIGVYVPANQEKTVYIDTIRALERGEGLVCDFDWSNDIPSNVTFTTQNSDTLTIKRDKANNLNSAVYSLHSTGDTHNAQIMIECERGMLAGDGLQFWEHSPLNDQWGTVILRSRDETGEIAWFKTKGMFGSDNTIFKLGGAGEAWVTINYADMREVENFSDMADDTMNAPSVEDILNFDAVLIMPLIWDGNPDYEFCLDSVTVVNPYDPDNLPEIKPYEKLWLEQTEYTINMGDTFTLQPKYLPADASVTRIRWTSDNPGAVTVNSRGFVIGANEGWATVTGVDKNTGLTVSCRIRVVAEDNNQYRELEDFDSGILTDEISLSKLSIDMEYTHTGNATGIKVTPKDNKASFTFTPDEPYEFYGNGFYYWSMQEDAISTEIVFTTNNGEQFKIKRNLSGYGDKDIVKYSDLRNSNGEAPDRVDIRSFRSVTFILENATDKNAYFDSFKVLEPKKYQPVTVPKNDMGGTGIIFNDQGNRLARYKMTIERLESGIDFDWAVEALTVNSLVEFAFDAVLYDVTFVDEQYNWVSSVGNVQLSIPVPDTHYGFSSLKVVKITDNGTIVDMRAHLSGEKMLFFADESAVYALIGNIEGETLTTTLEWLPYQEKNISEDAFGSSPLTGERMNTLPIAIFCFSSTLLLAIIYIGKKNNMTLCDLYAVINRIGGK